MLTTHFPYLAAFTGALAVTTPENPKLAVALGTLASFGVGGLLVPSATVALIVVPDALLATTAALSLSIRTIGGSIGFSIYYNIFANKLQKNLPLFVGKFAVDAGLPLSDMAEFVTTFLGKPDEITKVPGYSLTILEAATMGSKWAYSQALKWVWYTSIPFGILAIIGSSFIPSIRNYQTNRVAAAL